jgi:hypothetical protein
MPPPRLIGINSNGQQIAYVAANSRKGVGDWAPPAATLIFIKVAPTGHPGKATA